MKRPSAASLKRVTPENLARLGADRLAALLLEAAEGRAELKRRLRMELAGEQGAPHLALEVDKRLTALEASKARVSWRGRATFVRDLEGLRRLIGERLAELDPAIALARLWRFLDLATGVSRRVSDKDGELAAVFDRAAGDLGGLIGKARDLDTATALTDSIVRAPSRWVDWLPLVVEAAPRDVLAAALAALLARPTSPNTTQLIRRLADATGEVETFRATFSAAALQDPSIAAEVGARLLAAGRTAEAGAVLEGAKPGMKPARWPGGRPTEPQVDLEWEAAWIDYLEQSGQGGAAQDARWASFERTLSAERARAFMRRLTGFDDVEAEARAFAYARAYADVQRALRFFMDWPALPEAARLIEARTAEVNPTQDDAELWGGKLRLRHPVAAHLLLRKAAAVAFRRRDFAAADRLTAEADAIDLP